MDCALRCRSVQKLPVAETVQIFGTMLKAVVPVGNLHFVHFIWGGDAKALCRKMACLLSRGMFFAERSFDEGDSLGCSPICIAAQAADFRTVGCDQHCGW